MTLKICKKCGMKIHTKEKGVTWITFVNGINLEIIHWHWECFLEWRDSSLTNKATKIYQDTLKGMMPQFKGLIENITNDSQEKEFVIK